MEAEIDEPPSPYLLAEIINDPFWYFSLNGAILILLLLASALVSGSEVAFFSLSNDDVQKCRHSRNPSKKKIAKMLDNPRRLLATILILNNFVNVAIVMLSTMMVWRTYGKDPDKAILVTFTVILVLSITFFGEIIPKLFASQNNLKLAKSVSNGLYFFDKVFKPLSWVLLNTTGIIDKRFQKKGYDVSVDELHQALEITTKHEKSSEEEKEILKGIVNFGTLTVKQVMRSRVDVTAYEGNLNFHELMDKINKSGYSRIPVFTETIDKIDGILYIKDVLPFVDEEEGYAWQDLLRPAMFVPETKKVDSLLRDFQNKRIHLAVVVDEYGGTSGIITLEDIIEEIVGEINDEFDEEYEHYNKIDNNTYLFEGRTSLNDFSKAIGVDPTDFEQVKGESESLGGLILEIHSTLPSTGEKIIYDNYTFTIMAVDDKRIKRIKVQINEK